jgi:plasmid replication initiation protein
MTSNNGLLPDRNPQPDFFIADIFDNLPFKDDMASMGYPMFTLSKNKDLREIHYEKNGVNIFISPSFSHGLPTIFDKDVLLYCGSLLMEQINKGIIPPKTLRISTYDLLKATNRITTGEGYNLIEKALNRLTGVLITTNIKTNKAEQSKGFHLIESYEFIKSSFVKDRRVALEITLSDWFYNSIIGKEVLTINRDYFRLGRALERRLYEIARKHCGSQKEWVVSLQTLYEKSGSTAPLRKFRFFIHEIAAANHLPDYTMTLADSDMVTFRSTNDAKQPVNDLSDLPSLSPDTIRKGATLVEEAGTGWDYNAIRQQFTKELIDGFKPKSADGAFINFVKKKVKKCP